MSASPKLKASTFSVHDILSPLDAAAVTTNADTFLLLGCSGDAGDGPPAQSHHVKMSGSVSTPWPHGVATSHSSAGGFSGGAQYVNGAADLTSAYGVALTDSRPPHGAWYGTSSADPRFATDYSTLSTGTAFFCFCSFFSSRICPTNARNTRDWNQSESRESGAFLGPGCLAGCDGVESRISNSKSMNIHTSR